jgi:hypothetical protein
MNQMWILKNSKELLEKFQSQDLSKIDSIKTYDFSTLYTTIPLDKLFHVVDTLSGNRYGHAMFGCRANVGTRRTRSVSDNCDFSS